MDSGLDEEDKLTMNRAARTARSRRLDGVRRRTIPDESHLLDKSPQQDRPASSISAHEMQYTTEQDQAIIDKISKSPDVITGPDSTEDSTSKLQAPETSQIDNTLSKDDVSKEKSQPIYSFKKALIQGLMTFALLVNTYSQLKSLILTGARHRYYYIVMSINLFSLTSQILIGCLFLVILKIEANLERWRNKRQYADFVHNVIIILLLAVIGLNIILSSYTVSVYDS